MAEAAWIRVQRKTFSRWCNNFIVARNLAINELEKDLADGVILHNLLECLSNEKILPPPNKKAKLKLQKVENLNISLRYITSKNVKLVGIGAEDIHDGKSNLILGLIWTLILRFQISGDYGDDPGANARQALLDWCNSVLNPQGLSVQNFKDSWSDGRAFCGLVNALSPNEINLGDRAPDNAENNLNLAFDKAEELFNFPKVLDAIDVIQNPDDLSTMTYVSYFRAFLAANTASAEKSYAEGLGLTNAIAFEKASFTVYAVNDEGEKATRGGANIRSYLKDADGNDLCKVQIIDNRNGTYTCNYVPPTPGQFDLLVQIGPNQLRGSPFRPVVESGEPSPGHCEAHGPGIESATAGKPVQFFVQTKDSNGNNIAKGGAKIQAVLEDAAGKIPVSVVDNNDGTYTCTYTPHTASNSKLHVNVATQNFGTGPVAGAPFTVSVAPGSPSAATTEAYGPGTESADAGTPAIITVQTKDDYGNLLNTGGAPISVTAVNQENGSELPVEVLDNRDGTYSLTYRPEVMGNYEINVALGNQPIKDMPLSVYVNPGVTDLTSFIWEGLEFDSSGRRVIVAGTTDSFNVSARDSFGNPQITGGLDVNGSVSGPEDISMVVADHGDGSYDLSYTPTVTGDYTLTVSVGDEPIGGSTNPFPFVVIPAAPSSDNTVAYGDGLESAEIGKNNKFIVETRDKFDNKVGMGGADVGGHLESDDGSTLPIEVNDLGDGTYECSYPSVNKAGEYKVIPTLNGQPIKGAPFTLSVNPGDTSVDNTDISLPDIHLAGGDGPCVTLRDIFGNKKSTGGDKVVAYLKPKTRLKPVKAVDNGDGTYEISYPPHLKGKYDVEVKVNDAVVPGGPWEVDVNDNPLDPESEQKVNELVSPDSSRLFQKLLANATEEERAQILAELAALSQL